jgi:hypothetical protein
VNKSMSSNSEQSSSSGGSAFRAIASSFCELGLGSSIQTKAIEPDETNKDETRNVQTFFRDVWQEQPAIFRECPLSKAISIGWDDVASMLHHSRESESYAPLFFRNGNPITDPEERYANNPHAAYLDGCSIIVNHADFHHQIIANLCTDLQETFPHVYANCYLSPPDSHAVNAHADDRDVLVVQVLGSKKWKVYKEVPIRGPFENEQVGKNGLDVPQSVFDGGLCFDNKELTLTKGDVLYLPRGYVHEASTHTPYDNDASQTASEVTEPSFHITLAIATHDWCPAELITDAITKTLYRNPAFRDALPIGPCSEYGGSQIEPLDLLKMKIDDAMSEIKKNVTAEVLYENLNNKYMTHNSRASEFRRNIASRKRPREEDKCVGYDAASQLTLDSVVRASSAEERGSVVLEEGRLRGLTVREETMDSLMTIVGMMKQTPSLKIKVRDLLHKAGFSNPMICDFSLLSLARCCVEFGAFAVVEKE